ncbi:hypothetical protein RhiirC2_713899 [Rhizophagus irregularis]|uniref:Uncharacterized protein n=1 Tax=Rhizophagus irregularis TaxID=588596 RepID=A0A2N1N1F5_9GLOM|nr:hypothetical protein RhiirC2_713899 [Rhizophagus irregularis]
MRMSLHFGSIEIIEANVEKVIINKADEREKKWWIDGNYKIIDENRICSILLDSLLSLWRISRGFSKQSDASYTPKQLPKPAANSCDAQGNPWPTVIVEIANTQSLPSIIRKTTQFWLAPNRVEDVIILKLWNWNSRRDQNGIPLRCLTVQYYFLMSFHLFHSPNNYPVYFDSAINSVIEEALKMHVEITYQFKQ